MMDPTVLILLVGEASGVFAGFCPSWFTVASPFFHEQEAKEGNINRIRAGEIAATLIVVGTGWAVSRRESSNWAIWASIIICLVFVFGYEFQIRHPAKQHSDIPAVNTLADVGTIFTAGLAAG